MVGSLRRPGQGVGGQLGGGGALRGGERGACMMSARVLRAITFDLKFVFATENKV
ncbi:hypothetical protein ABT300_21140 [Streptomyces sp. NPDC001027]|uniref:hypothetical protein n=1 Tax=Streptomyces sp. NPDC001027 TaxID=3154771 RepID=UPI0033285B65